jgi:NAD(P)-dependent dehydrogenase (short-subunit alcohol dehydrogenase family)
MSTITGAIVVITGAGKGVGQGLAYEAARRGAKVVVASPHEATETLETITALGGEAAWFEADVSDYSSISRIPDLVIDRFGAINVLVNNAAGAGSAGGLQDADPETVRRQFEINILGVFNGIHAFFPSLKAAADRGELAHVLNVGSEHSLGVPPYVPAVSTYTVSKYTTRAFTDVARRDFQGTGVGVSLVAPGWVLTDAVRGLLELETPMKDSIRGRGQETEFVAAEAFDGMLSGRHLIPTNPASREFAIAQATELIDSFGGLQEWTPPPTT